MNRSRIQQLTDDVLAARLAGANDLEGCSDEEIVSLEVKFGLQLPALYRDWLRTMGRGAGQFLKGSDCFFPEISELRGNAEELLAENGSPFELPKDAFVFLMHQGYQFLYFRTIPALPDPPVTHYLEGDSPVEQWAHLSQYFRQVLDDQIRIHRQIETGELPQGPRKA